MSIEAPNKRLRPSLLDRLQDDEPQKQKDSSNEQAISLNRLRELILRDIAWLLNCDNLECVQDLSSLPDVSNSVLNYGIPSFSGVTLSSTDSSSVENTVKNAILKFEPRIIPQSLTVNSVTMDSPGSGRKTIALEIGGDIWAKPFSLEFLLRSELDLDTGQVTISEAKNRN